MITTQSTGHYTLEAIAEIFMRSFEGYFYPAQVTAADLAHRVRLEQIDLWGSLVLVEDEQPIGIAVLAQRGTRIWCGGFGIVKAARGRGLAHTLAAAMVAQARTLGATEFSLEVLTRNTPAIRVYQQAGLTIWRDLFVFYWQRPDDWSRPADTAITEIAPEQVWASFNKLHPTSAAWQRDLPTLLSSKLRALAVYEENQLVGYLLFQGNDGERLRISDLAARDPQIAERLIIALQQRATAITSVNEPSNSPLSAAYLTAGFQEVDRQHDMRMGL